MLSPPRTSEGTLPTDYTFTGQRVDASAGLMYYHARYYDAALGRFIQPDTIVPNLYNPQSLNRYSYVYNNPLRYKDPSGKTPWDVVDVFFWAWSFKDFIQKPSWENAGWLALDTAGLLPILPSVGWARRGAQGVSAVHDAERFARVAAIEKLLKGGLEASERADLIKDIAKAATRNSDATHVLLGTHPEYKNLAKLEGMAYFDMSPEIWELLKNRPDLVWDVNKQFIDDMIKEGKSFVVAVGEGRKAGEGLTREIKYLDDLVEQGILTYIDGVYVPIK